MDVFYYDAKSDKKLIKEYNKGLTYKQKNRPLPILYAEIDDTNRKVAESLWNYFQVMSNPEHYFPVQFTEAHKNYLLAHGMEKYLNPDDYIKVLKNPHATPDYYHKTEHWLVMNF